MLQLKKKTTELRSSETGQMLGYVLDFMQQTDTEDFATSVPKSICIQSLCVIAVLKDS